MKITMKRVYEDAEPNDGMRILVDRLWPRGLKKEKANIDLWAKDLAPSNELRKWYGHDPKKWEMFKKKYFAELDGKTEDVKKLRDLIGKKPAVFLFSSKEPELNNAQALILFLEKKK